MQDTLTQSLFEPLIGASFRLRVGAKVLELELVQAVKLTAPEGLGNSCSRSRFPLWNKRHSGTRKYFSCRSVRMMLVSVMKRFSTRIFSQGEAHEPTICW